MKKIVWVLLPLFFLSCAKKEVKLPTLPEKGIQEMQNHSQVWLFFEMKDKDTVAIVNSKNTISTTHWIFNIDKRLPLKTIMPSIIKLQNTHANSLHSEEGMHNYFSYADTVSKKLSFLEFDDVNFILSKNIIEVENSSYNNINLIFNQNNIFINGLKTEKSNFKNELLALSAIASEGNQLMLQLYFSQNLLYQDYLFYRTTIHALGNENILINKNEFIFK
ncbi:MAG: hypothetical protein WC389_10625 [Lutibacter sp.]|jgi:hypothetical protein